ncbi:aminoacyl-tRNA hydrolase [candidate division KSB1 bacterium]
MYCIMGLGNPEPRYSLTRHNIGFQVADKIANSLNITFSKGKGEYYSAKGKIEGSGILLVKPITYMNRSGFAAGHVLNYFDISLEKFIVILDDLDLPFGTLRLRPEGNDGGNKGLRSIIGQTGSKDFTRLRFGIRNRERIANPSSYVLSNFTRREQKYLPDLIDLAESAVETWITDGIEKSMNLYNANHLS